eukprot:TRINITY_DN56058_c0_g1_i1.p2 TRINITY_DN56058_c0_g1~~TRINITY_DN56058_c0_g1_i1.p2  ORF type:complete len:369 (+),score=118.72 TRINITY_DN56058_c0_g1_i1:89-1195(+)
MAQPEGPPAVAQEAVFVGSGEMPPDSIAVEGPNLSAPGGVGSVLSSYLTTGYQATNYGIACDEARAMLKWRLIDDPVALATLRVRSEVTDNEAMVTRTRIFLGITSSMLLSGVREAACFVCRHRMVHCVVTPGGGIDNDLIRTLAPAAVRVGGSGARQANITVDHARARAAVMPYVARVLAGVAAAGPRTTPSALIRALAGGLREAAPDAAETSVIYWCAERDIPIFSPSIVDGLIGEAIFAFNREQVAAGRPALQVDLIEDIRGMNTQATTAKHTGMIILGGGLVKHHICNANLMRNGSDHSVFIGTGQEFDGSDAGARPDEAVSWGKIRIDTKFVKVYVDAALVFPALVAQVFVPFFRENRNLYPQ